MNTAPPKLDEVGFWSEIKLEIIKRYAEAYSMILHGQKKYGRKLDHYYIDAFAGAGRHLSKNTHELIPGSPLNALLVNPPFKGYFFIDLNGLRVDALRELAQEHGNATILEGDCNDTLLRNVFPKVKYEQYRRALCLLDPYGLHLKWEVMQTAGQMRSVEIFLNFPIMDMNMNVLKRDIDRVDAVQLGRMDSFWGDRTWVEAAYDTQNDLFGYPEKTGNEDVVQAFQKRLREVAGFKYVPNPLPMRNTSNSVVYYLFFASHNETGAKIAGQLFDKFRQRMAA